MYPYNTVAFWQPSFPIRLQLVEVGYYINKIRRNRDKEEDGEFCAYHHWTFASPVLTNACLASSRLHRSDATSLHWFGFLGARTSQLVAGRSNWLMLRRRSSETLKRDITPTPIRKAFVNFSIALQTCSHTTEFGCYRSHSLLYIASLLSTTSTTLKHKLFTLLLQHIVAASFSSCWQDGWFKRFRPPSHKEMQSLWEQWLAMLQN